MKSTELRERLNKSEANVEKIKKTIERHKQQAEKKLAVINKNKWTLDRYQYVGGGTTPNEDAYWAICEYEGKLSDVTSAEKKLAEAMKIRDNWKAKLERQLELENKIQNEIPEVFKQVKADLVEAWVSWDIREREYMFTRNKELRDLFGYDWEDFNQRWREMYSYNKEESLRHTDAEFRKMEEEIAEEWLLDLYNRVYTITGKITDCSGIRWGGKCLDGIVIGEAGSASVTTIAAGGYNENIILSSGRHGQRLHLRTLVKEV